jgi:uncharacterized protein (TIGR01777 family)
MSRILISGSSGFVGRVLVPHLRSLGYTVVSLSRNPDQREAIFWNPEEGILDKEALEDFQAVIHLAGEPLSLGRWTQQKKEAILRSRTVTTALLSQTIAQLFHPPKLFLSASAIGIYGDRGEEVLTEESSIGRGFLPGVCTEWEGATRAVEKRGVRVVQTRFGMIVGPDGGAVQKMRLIYRMGLGGRLGTGQQWVSWVDREDVVRAIAFILANDSLTGPVNVTSPHPERQIAFAQILAQLLHRPAKLALPARLLKLILGTAAEELILASTRVSPHKLLAAKFSFQAPFLRDSLRKFLR